MIKVKALGTGAGRPTKERNVSAYALHNPRGKFWSLVDCGDGTALRCAQEGMNLDKLRTIYITHSHSDHWFGVAGVLASMVNVTFESIKIVCSWEVRQAIETMLETADVELQFAIEWIEYSGLPMEIGPYTVDIFPLHHRVDSWGYCFTYNHGNMMDGPKMDADGIPNEIRRAIRDERVAAVTTESGEVVPASQYIKGSESYTVCMCGDNASPNLLSDYCKGADMVFHECTYTDEDSRKANKYMHTSSRWLGIEARLADIKKLVITHFSGGTNVEFARMEVTREYSGGLDVAHDGSEHSI